MIAFKNRLKETIYEKLKAVYPVAIEDLDMAPTPDPKMGGFRLMVSNEVMRARFRNSGEKPEPMVPGKVTPVTIDLHTQSYRFLKGHRVMVQVQSSWFPIIDRNPQTWVANIFEAKESDFKAQTHRMFRTKEAASRVEVLTVVP